MPAIIAFLAALLTAFLQTRTLSFSEKITVIAKGLADENIITMCLIFLTAGAFSGAVSAAGGVEHTVNLGLKLLPASWSARRTVYYRLFSFHIHGNKCRNDFRTGTDCGRYQ